MPRRRPLRDITNLRHADTEPESSESEPEYVHQNSILARRYRQRRDAVPRQARSRSRSPVRRSRSRTPDYSPVRRRNGSPRRRSRSRSVASDDTVVL
ncbi:Maph54 [Matsumuraeses phaseoli granulovirus]|uniref:Maph54 n=1 Tax=Matsumuraeses phaseoli granulovirus TaxID=2760664 RepID=A0AAE7SYQ3_9BBAC|nr:Maph54 [Matsumuraeses phaseoli granulovirus]QOD40017.1 Maph54 [Matsumuraeses phaseoli granulovirus]